MNHVKTQGWSNRFDRDTVFFGRVMAPDRLGFQTWACSLWTSWFSASSSTFWACLETWGPVQDRTSRVSGSPWGLWEEGVTSGKASRHSAPRCLRDILCFFLVIRTMASHYLRVIYIYICFFSISRLVRLLLFKGTIWSKSWQRWNLRAWGFIRPSRNDQTPFQVGSCMVSVSSTKCTQLTGLVLGYISSLGIRPANSLGGQGDDGGSTQVPSTPPPKSFGQLHNLPP